MASSPETRFNQVIAAAKAVLEKVAADCSGLAHLRRRLRHRPGRCREIAAQGKSERVTLPKLQELMGQAIALRQSRSVAARRLASPNG